jgi:transketolase
MRDQFIATLTELAEHDSRIMLVTGDLGFGVLDSFAKRFPQQYINAGVAEQNMTGLATGLAMDGYIVFTYSIANFSTLRCLEQIRNDAAYHEVNVNIVSVGAGFSYGPLGYSHHATEDLAILRSLPNVTTTSPCDLWEVDHITRYLVKKTGVGYLRLDKSAARPTHSNETPFEFGEPRVVRQGLDLTLVATGGILEEALVAAESLAAQNISARVIAVHSFNFSRDQVLTVAAQETKGMICVEEHSVIGGLGGAVAEHLLEGEIRPKFFYRVGLRDGFSTIVGSQKYLRQRYKMESQAISSVALELLKRK